MEGNHTINSCAEHVVINSLLTTFKLNSHSKLVQFISRCIVGQYPLVFGVMSNRPRGTDANIQGYWVFKVWIAFLLMYLNPTSLCISLVPLSSSSILYFCACYLFISTNISKRRTSKYASADKILHPAIYKMKTLYAQVKVWCGIYLFVFFHMCVSAFIYRMHVSFSENENACVHALIGSSNLVVHWVSYYYVWPCTQNLKGTTRDQTTDICFLSDQSMAVGLKSS